MIRSPLRNQGRLCVAYLVVALLPVSVHAWTEDERANLRLAYEVPGYLCEALRYLAAEPDHIDALKATASAHADAVRMVAILSGVSPENEGDTGARARWAARSRKDQLDGQGGAWFHAARALGGIRAALILTEPRNPPALIHLRNARAALQGIDRHLLYTSSLDGPVIGRPGIGHGSLDLATNPIYTSLGYDRRWLVSEWLDAYRGMGPDPVIRMQVGQWIVVTSAKLRAMGLLARVYSVGDPPGRELTLDQRRACDVLEAFRLLWMDGAQGYHFAMHGDPLTDGWRTGIDAASQAAFELPLCRDAR